VRSPCERSCHGEGLPVSDLVGLVYPSLTSPEMTKIIVVEFLKSSAQNLGLRRLISSFAA
jgi:hypothetical protein